MAFTPLTLTNAALEGIGSFSKLASENNEEFFNALQTFLSLSINMSDANNESSHSLAQKILLQNFECKKKALQNLLILGDTGSLDYKRFSFIIQLLWDFMNPRLSPFFYKNPSLAKAMASMLALTSDETSKNTSDSWNFIVGENLATAKGYVIFENEVMQLLYFPTSHKQKRKNPVFLVPPWINKYYIFDLSSHNSFIIWLNDHGISVYCISWVNPDSTFSNLKLAHYVIKGIHKGVEKAIQNENGGLINLIGYCVGGIALALYAGWSKHKNRQSYASLTFLATPFDFNKLDNLRLFICEEQLGHIERMIEKDGFFSGRSLAQTFSLMRANDMIIQGIIDQIYLEKEAKPLDFLYWNTDITHLPGKMHLEYLRTFFIGDGFSGQEEFSGIPINLQNVNCPVYVLGAIKDHIIPWQACYASHNFFDNITFCLGGSGHVSGIINPPSQHKYGYRTSCASLDLDSADDWLNASTEHAGSWWTHWHEWITPHLGDYCNNKKIDHGIIIESTPGRYALQKAVPAKVRKEK